MASTSWQFGDGTTGSGTSVSHTYATAGTRTVTLTVTDNAGATATSSRSITVGAAQPAELARDDFGRTTTGGWGTAPVGGAWTLGSTTTSAYSTDGSSGRITSTGAGRTYEAFLGGVTTTSADVRATTTATPVPAGGSVYLSLIGRRVGTADYRARAVISAQGAITLQLNRSGTTVASTAAGTFADGDRLQLRLQVTGTSPTTLRAKLWKAGTAEPAAWQVTFSDSTAELQTAGSSGLGLYVGSSVTSLPTTAGFDDFSLVAAG
ncbi:PKD domain-containing protein [Naasia aerilata]|uniref:PKD domain-containing protein n=1 Tax=Naasia aerilata TaxID=1162966 RepID=UPI003D9B6B54